MSTPLPKIETWAYFIIWIGGVSYSVYHVYLMSSLYDKLDYAEDLAPGWYWLNRRKDVADFEWRHWLPFLWQLLPWFGVHHVVVELLRCLNIVEAIHVWHILGTTLFVLEYAGLSAMLTVVFQPCVLLLASFIGGHVGLWTTSLSIIIGLNFFHSDELSSAQHYALCVCISWLHLRALSFCTDLLKKKQWSCSNENRMLQILQLLSYSLYLPLMFLGPFVPYQQYVEGVYKENRPSLLLRLTHLLLNSARFLGWMLFTEWALHFIYCNAIQLQYKALPLFDAWTLNGLAYCIGQFFLNKYVIIYGLMGTLAQFDGISAPPTPRCIAHVSLYSDMWRHFDRGFYKFLLCYIYKPLQEFQGFSRNPSAFRLTLHRLFCSIVCFTFVYVWHGLALHILIWSICNFLGLTVEAMARNIASGESYQELERYLSDRNKRRWRALLTSPLFIASALTMFYFFGGLEVGNTFVLQIVSGSFQKNCILLFFAYCMCQVSIEIKHHLS